MSCEQNSKNGTLLKTTFIFLEAYHTILIQNTKQDKMDGDYSQGENDRDYRRGFDRRGDRGRRRDGRKPRERIRRDRDQRSESNDQNEADNIHGKGPSIILAKKNQSETGKRETPTILGIQRRGGYETPPVSSTSSSTSSTTVNMPTTTPTKTLFTETYNRPSKPTSNVNSSTIPSPATPTQTKPITSTTASLSKTETTTTAKKGPDLLTGIPALKLPNDIVTSESISLVDSNFNWSDKAFDCLLDQSDYTVVGCVGLQGAGKSTVMSMLAGQKIESIEKTRLVFRPQKKADLEKCIHRTVGIDMYVTHERLILLDTQVVKKQPLLSPSMLDQYLRYDRKVPSEYATAELCLEVQALQLLSFLYTVCHVVFVIQDNFTDIHLLNLLKTAEMLKPATISNASQDSSNGNSDEYSEYYPHICFLFTCCADRSFEADTVLSMCEILSKMFDASRLRVRGSASIIRTPVLPYYYSDLFMDYHDFNLFLLPELKSPLEDSSVCPISKYEGRPSLQSLMKILRQHVVAMAREPFTHHVLSEKNWFHFAARTWEAVKKSNLVNEYHRLLAS